jgi:DHA2 family multidrug resistance protein-like MFS transporter
LSGRLSDRFPPAILGGFGLIGLTVGMLLMATLPAHPSDFAILWRTGVCGIGFGFFNAPNNRAMLGATPPHRSGGASGMIATARGLGQTIGAAMVALCFEIAPTSGATVALLAGGGCAATAAAASFLRNAARKPA